MSFHVGLWERRPGGVYLQSMSFFKRTTFELGASDTLALKGYRKESHSSRVCTLNPKP